MLFDLRERKERKDFYEALEVLGEHEVRKLIPLDYFSKDKVCDAMEWLAQRNREKQSSMQDRRGARAEETLALAKKANRNAWIAAAIAVVSTVVSVVKFEPPPSPLLPVDSRLGPVVLPPRLPLRPCHQPVEQFGIAVQAGVGEVPRHSGPALIDFGDQGHGHRDPVGHPVVIQAPSCWLQAHQSLRLTPWPGSTGCPDAPSPSLPPQ